MQTIAITGAGGFLAWHLHCHLHALGWGTPLLLTRDIWDSFDKRCDLLRRADVVVHLAGINRAKPTEVEHGNITLASQLVETLESCGVKPHVIFSSTTHTERETVYGRAKQRAGEVLGDWAVKHQAPFTNLIIPHIFGEQCRPFYNSAVATFCYQIANHQKAVVDNNIQLELLHAQDVCAEIIRCIELGINEKIRLIGHKIMVSEVLEVIRSLDASYRSDVIPDLRDRITLQLFNTYRGYLFPKHYPVRLKLHSDNRGSLFEAVKGHNGGQTFLSTTKSGVTRGNHYHLNKVERFLVIQGEAIIKIRKLFSNEISEFKVSGTDPVYIDMPTLHTHSITNIGDSDLITLFWSDSIFDATNPDTVREQV